MSRLFLFSRAQFYLLPSTSLFLWVSMNLFHTKVLRTVGITSVSDVCLWNQDHGEGWCFQWEHPHQNNLSKTMLPFIMLSIKYKLRSMTLRPFIICACSSSSPLSTCFCHTYPLSSWEALSAGGGCWRQGAQASCANGAQLQALPIISRFNLGQIISSGNVGSSFANKIKVFSVQGNYYI